MPIEIFGALFQIKQTVHLAPFTEKRQEFGDDLGISLIMTFEEFPLAKSLSQQRQIQANAEPT